MHADTILAIGFALLIFAASLWAFLAIAGAFKRAR